MWVTGGTAKGTRLKTLPGRSIRPTTSIVRQAIFSLLENTAPGWGRFLDLYAGTGALGIEALSRGGEWVDFVDQRKSCCGIIKANLERVGQSDRAHVYCISVSRALATLSGEYDVAFMDPPYSDPSLDRSVLGLAESRLLGPDGVLVVLHAGRFPLRPDYDGLQLVKQRRYGDTFIFMYRKEGCS